jgi:hypothetical protein
VGRRGLLKVAYRQYQDRPVRQVLKLLRAGIHIVGILRDVVKKEIWFLTPIDQCEIRVFVDEMASALLAIPLPILLSRNRISDECPNRLFAYRSTEKLNTGSIIDGGNYVERFCSGIE